MTYDVAIIGAGTAGVYAGYELLQLRPHLKILILEMGADIYKRQCPIVAGKVRECISCKPCSIMSGFGGAGAFSDGKYNFTTQFGGWLGDYLGDEELMRLIDRCAAVKGLCQDILLEVNIGGEAAKSGFRPEEIPAALAAAAQFDHIMVRGLMAIPPKCSRAEENIPYFCSMQKLFVDNGAKKYDNVHMGLLSMGMSADYTAAIACGSNMVRVGTAIFGARDYGPINSNNSGGSDGTL